MTNNPSHYEHIYNNVIRQVFPEAKEGIGFESFSIDKCPNWPGFKREIQISELDADTKFTVTYIDTLVDPNFTVSNSKQTYIGNNPNSMLMVCHDVGTFLTRPMTPRHLNTLQTVVKKANEINQQWMGNTGCKVVPYLQGYELDNEWRYKIVDAVTGTIHYCCHLNPATADGHTYAMFVSAIKETYTKGIVEGSITAIEKLAAQQLSTVLSDHVIQNIPIPVVKFISSKTLGR